MAADEVRSLPDALLAALIAAPAGSRELDAIVAVAANWRHPLYVNDRWPQIYNEWKDTVRVAEKAQNYGVPKFTTSIDAALSLVPEGMNYILGRGRTRADEPLFGAQILHDQTVIADGETDAGLALAIVIASLRARDSGA